MSHRELFLLIVSALAASASPAQAVPLATGLPPATGIAQSAIFSPGSDRTLMLWGVLSALSSGSGAIKDQSAFLNGEMQTLERQSSQPVITTLHHDEDQQSSEALLGKDVPGGRILWILQTWGSTGESDTNEGSSGSQRADSSQAGLPAPKDPYRPEMVSRLRVAETPRGLAPYVIEVSRPPRLS
jgi:hypothetical protein